MGSKFNYRLYLQGVHLGLSEDERLANDMMKTGRFCPNDNEELEKVSAEDRYTCHWCGGIFRINEEGQIIEVWFKGS